MSDHERRELIPCVIIKDYDNSSDSEESSEESIMVDATSKIFTEITGNVGERNDGDSYVNHKSVNTVVTRPKVEGVTIANCNDTIIGNVTYFEGPVTIKKCINDYSNIVDETISDKETEPIITDSREIDTTTTTDDVDISHELKKSNWFRKNQILVLLVAAVLLVSATYFTTNYFSYHAQNDGKQRNDSDKFEYTSDYEVTTVQFQYNFKFRVITRSEWQAENPKSPLMNLILPSIRVIIAHTATRTCLSQASCSSMLRSMQKYHFRRGWDDISYNFLVGGDGSAYVGRGWDKEGDHVGRYNEKSICISFIGNFTEIIPSQRQKIAAQKLIEQGLLLGKLVPYYRLYGHRQVLNTASPGNVLYEIIKKWDHWSKVVV